MGVTVPVACAITYMQTLPYRPLIEYYLVYRNEGYFQEIQTSKKELNEATGSSNFRTKNNMINTTGSSY